WGTPDPLGGFATAAPGYRHGSAHRWCGPGEFRPGHTTTASTPNNRTGRGRTHPRHRGGPAGTAPPEPPCRRGCRAPVTATGPVGVLRAGPVGNPSAATRPGVAAPAAARPRRDRAGCAVAPPAGASPLAGPARCPE